MSDSGFDIYDDESWAVPNVSQDDLSPVPEAWEPETTVEEAPLQAQTVTSKRLPIAREMRSFLTHSAPSREMSSTTSSSLVSRVRSCARTSRP